jgi:uncharacterized protein (DUF2336 family)
MAAQQPVGTQTTIVARLLAWARHADADRRADAANALARAYLHSEFDAETRREAELGLYALLDDPSSHVRRALAEGLAGGAGAPAAMIMALAADTSDVAAVVLRRSPVLTDADLVDCAAAGDVEVQIAIAERPALSVGVSAALAEVGAREAVLALLDNLDAEIAPLSLARIAQRFLSVVEICDRLTERPDLPPNVRHELAAAAAGRLSTFVTQCGWLSPERMQRIAQESCEKAILTICDGAREGARAGLVRYLRAKGALTTALLMRSALSGDPGFNVAALAELADMPAPRVAGVMRQPKGGAFAALCTRAGLSPISAFGLGACLAAASSQRSTGLSLKAVERALADVGAARLQGAADLAALLRRFAAEAAREEARAFVERSQIEIGETPVPAPVVSYEAASASLSPAIAYEAEGVVGAAILFDDRDEGEELVEASVFAAYGAAIPVVDWPGEENVEPFGNEAPELESPEPQLDRAA